jgi:hypothetical protein
MHGCLQAVAHFLLAGITQPVPVDSQHFVPILDLGLEQIPPGRFHIFCPFKVPLLTTGDISNRPDCPYAVNPCPRLLLVLQRYIKYF